MAREEEALAREEESIVAAAAGLLFHCCQGRPIALLRSWVVWEGAWALWDAGLGGRCGPCALMVKNTDSDLVGPKPRALVFGVLNG